MVIVMRTTQRTTRLVLHQSTSLCYGATARVIFIFPLCNDFDIIRYVLNIGYDTIYAICWLMCVTDLWAHIRLCIPFYP